MTTWFEKVDIVRPSVIIRQLYDRIREGNFAVMVSTLLSYKCRQLRNFHLILEILLETGEHHLALRGFETIGHVSDGPLEICETEIYQVLVYKVCDVQLFHTSIWNFKLISIFCGVLQKPRLSGISLLFVKGENN